MLGHYGWILVQEAIDHEHSERNGAGRVYLGAKDVKAGARLREGDQVAFFLYADSHGLGAEDCTLVPRKVAPPPGFIPPVLDNEAEFPGLAGGVQKGSLRSDAPASASQLKDHSLRPDAPVFRPLAAQPTSSVLAAWLEDVDSEDEGGQGEGLRADAPVFEPMAAKQVDSLRPDAPVFQPMAAQPKATSFINPSWLEDSDSEDESDAGESWVAADKGGEEGPSRRACRAVSPDAATSAGDTSSGSEEDFAEKPCLPTGFRPPPGLPPPRGPVGGGCLRLSATGAGRGHRAASAARKA